MKPVFVARVAALVAIAGFAFACTDRPDVAGPPEVSSGPSANAVTDFIVTCSANVTERTIKCGEPNNGVKSDLIYGGQGTYVKLTSSSIAVVADTMAFDVDVQNLLGQRIGTTDSSATPDPNGVRVFFVQGPTANVGTVTVANPDGINVFTGANQAYYKYFGVIEPGEVSGTKRWKFRFSQPNTFTFQVGISAPVEFQHGYIDGTARVLTLNPSESFTLPAKIHSALGTLQSGAVSWTSNNTAVATVVDSTVTGHAFGYSVLTGVNNSRPTASDVYVDVCPYITVSNGTTYADSVTNSDCFAALTPEQGFLPSSDTHGDLYRVTISAGQTITITVDTGNGLDTELVLADRLGNVLAWNDDDEVGTLSPGSRVDYTATASGTYVIQVLTLNPGNTGNYTLHITLADPI